jgi:pimeloyl-ACP methyl ester carboxylesterase
MLLSGQSLGLGLLLAGSGQCLIPGPFRASHAVEPAFNWTDVKPSQKLVYHDCYDEYKCARLIVPLDWTNASNPNEVVLAITKLPAKVPVSDPRFGGTVVTNPGGPGGSGSDDVRYNGHSVQNIVDGEKHFEILSFDPRGVHRTTPSPSCFQSPEAREIFLELNKLAGGPDIPRSLDIKWAMSQGLGQLCAEAPYGVYPNGDNIKQFVTTSLVAHDMVRIIDAVAEEQTESPSSRDGGQMPIVVTHEKPLLNYWGFSYGTYLGNTFASMFPSRIGRMILDGNVDADDYAATGWSTNLYDNNQVWRTFFEWCFEAGPKCELYDQQFQNPIDLHANVVDLFEKFKTDPMPFIDTQGRVNVLTYFNLEYTMHAYAYNPWHHWRKLARNLASLLQGDPFPFLDLNSTKSPTNPLPNATYADILSAGDDTTPDPRFLNTTTPYPPDYAHSLEAAISVLCGDGSPLPDSKSSYASYVSDLVNQSALIGPTWAQITLPCRHWPESLRPAERNRFAGPFGSNLSSYALEADPNKGAWARPLLFIGNTADPVTPVRNALRMSETHEGSVVLTQNAPGHCSGPTHPSRCVWESIRAFYNAGELPKKGKRCEIDWKPWDRTVSE